MSSVFRSAFILLLAEKLFHFFPLSGADAASEASSGFYIVEFKVECEASFSNLIMHLKSVVSHVSARLKGAWASRASYELLRDEEKAIADCRKKDSVIEERHGNINGDNEVELVKRHSNGKQRGAENQTKDGQGKRRLASLDVFRGLTVAVWIFIFSENLFLYCENAHITKLLLEIFKFYFFCPHNSICLMCMRVCRSAISLLLLLCFLSLN